MFCVISFCPHNNPRALSQVRLGCHLTTLTLGFLICTNGPDEVYLQGELQLSEPTDVEHTVGLQLAVAPRRPCRGRRREGALGTILGEWISVAHRGIQ